jgi:Ribosomal protein TL5, C-terminal domain
MLARALFLPERFGPHPERLLRSLLTSASPSGYSSPLPIVGEVPRPVAESDQPFWLQVDPDKLPPQYRHAEAPPQYATLPILYGAFREETDVHIAGSWASRKLRRCGLTPALLELPLGQKPRKLVLPSAQISTAFRQYGLSFPNVLCLLRIVRLEDTAMFNRVAADAQAMAEANGLPEPLHTFQVLPRRPSYNSVAGELQGITLISCASTRIVESQVPIMPRNEEESPSGRTGGFALVTRKTIPVRSLATNIPIQIEIDCGDFGHGDKVFVRDLVMPEGQVIVGVHPDTCLLKMDIGTG